MIYPSVYYNDHIWILHSRVYGAFFLPIFSLLFVFLRARPIDLHPDYIKWTPIRFAMSSSPSSSMHSFWN
ncbi:hypothetical protein PNOK_0510500 [Pyrrhoderma noxium]|uniref:Uncharacterized protein n=1 Tax=Pyrrhoderma noxium TaxID=2282107 RepID=A0A286UKN6_9AGAM|nr:hypothetical protein PNOK_0510500 [Pyrrhoderma noxium]